MVKLCQTRRELPASVKKNIVLLRYGSLNRAAGIVARIADVARLLHLSYRTVYSLLLRHKRLGEACLVTRQKSSKGCWHIGSPQIERELLSQDALLRSAHLSMQARAYKILTDYGFYVNSQRLRAFYIRNRVKYRLSLIHI